MPKYIDLTLPIDGVFRFKVDFKRDLSHEKDGAQATSFHISAHAFTHLDASLHMVPTGKSIDVIPVDFFIGDAVLLDIPKGKNEAITAADMERAGSQAKNDDIVLIRTGWLEKMWGKDGYDDCPYLTADAAEWLVRLKARIVGYDFVEDYSVRDFHRKRRVEPEQLVVHQILLRDGILNLEYVNNLSKVSQPRFKVIALPLPLKGCDGSLTRVVAIED